MKKYGKIGAPHSAKRKRFLAKVRRSIHRKYKGYGSKRAFKADRRKKGHRPLKKYKKGYGGQGDW
jgi:hypothetical protein